jgi:hypothetical protein
MGTAATSEPNPLMDDVPDDTNDEPTPLAESDGEATEPM